MWNGFSWRTEKSDCIPGTLITSLSSNLAHASSPWLEGKVKPFKKTVTLVAMLCELLRLFTGWEGWCVVQTVPTEITAETSECHSNLTGLLGKSWYIEMGNSIQHYIETQTAEDVSAIYFCGCFYIKKATNQRKLFSLWSLLVFVAVGIDELEHSLGGLKFPPKALDSDLNRVQSLILLFPEVSQECRNDNLEGKCGKQLSSNRNVTWQFWAISLKDDH